MKKCPFERWEKTRGIGKGLFILVYGVLLFGLLSGGLYAFIFPLIFGTSPELKGILNPLDLKGILIPLIVFPIMGILWGLGMWIGMEFWYKRHLANAHSGCENHLGEQL